MIVYDCYLTVSCGIQGHTSRPAGWVVQGKVEAARSQTCQGVNGLRSDHLVIAC